MHSNAVKSKTRQAAGLCLLVLHVAAGHIVACIHIYLMLFDKGLQQLRASQHVH